LGFHPREEKSKESQGEKKRRRKRILAPERVLIKGEGDGGNQASEAAKEEKKIKREEKKRFITSCVCHSMRGQAHFQAPASKGERIKAERKRKDRVFVPKADLGKKENRSGPRPMSPAQKEGEQESWGKNLCSHDQQHIGEEDKRR